MMNKEERKAELQEIQNQILEAVENASVSPEKWLELIEFIKKFGAKYSLKNTLLLGHQGAIVVDSYKGWQRRGYQVKKGSKALKLIFPTTHKYFRLNGKRKAVSKATKEEKELIKNGTIKIREYSTFIVKRRVFDVTQTDIPNEKVPELYSNRHHDFEGLSNEQIKKIELTIQEIAQKIDVKVNSKSEWGAFGRVLAKGYYVPMPEKVICTNPNNTDTENAKTLIHELAHAILDENSNNVVSQKLKLTLKPVSYALGELQAEMIAKIVTSYFGMEQEQSIRYIASWTNNGKKLQALEAKDKLSILDDVLKISNFLIEKIEE